MAYGEGLKRLSPCDDEFICAFVAEFSPAELLDVGCGRGDRLEALSRRFPEMRLAGVDSDTQLAAMARERVRGEIHLASASELPFEDGRFEACLCGNLSAVEIAKNLGLNIIADTGLNIHNSHSANAINDLGAKAVILSPELTCDAVRNLASPVPKGIIAYGNIPLMLFKNCPIKNGKSCSECDKTGFLTDRLGTQFPVRCRMGYSELLNSVPLWLGDKQNDLSSLDFQVLYFTNETKKEVNEIITDFKNGKSSTQKYTRGLFYKGTI